MLLAKVKEYEYIAEKFEKFVDCTSTYKTRDFCFRYDISASKLNAILRWADINIKNYKSAELKFILKNRGVHKQLG